MRVIIKDMFLNEVLHVYTVVQFQALRKAGSRDSLMNTIEMFNIESEYNLSQYVAFIEYLR